MKKLKLYLTENDIREKLGEEYKNSNIIFISANIDRFNCVNFECIIADEKIEYAEDKRIQL